VNGRQLPERPVLAAPVAGWAAYVIGAVLDDALPARLVALARLVERGQLHPDRLVEVQQAWAAIRAAGQQWKDWRASLDGSTAGPVTAIPAGLVSQEIDTTAAADLLGVTPNRIRQLVRAGDLTGRRVGRTWLVDRASTELRKAV
jgi:excisionase family DNA binding protein